METCVRAMVAAAKDHKENGAALFLHRTQTWRANPDWAERVGVGQWELEKLIRQEGRKDLYRSKELICTHFRCLISPHCQP